MAIITLAAGFAGFYQAASAQGTEKKTAAANAKPEVKARDEIKQINADFPGGIEKFYSYILSNVKPDSTCCPGKKIYVRFIIDKTGKLCHAKVRGRSLSKKMNAQLVKVFESAPQWTPAEQNGCNVRQHFVCPVIFMPKPEMTANLASVK